MWVVIQIGSTLWRAFGPGISMAPPAPPALDAGLLLAFMFLGLLAERVGSILERQAAEIASLKRQMNA
jgi:hypothetical protein